MSLTLSVPMAQELVNEAIKIGNLSNRKQIEKIFAGEQTHLLFKVKTGASFYENLLLNGWTNTELTECINEILMSFASIYADVFSVFYTRESPIKNLGRLSGGAGADNIILHNKALSVPEFKGLSFEQVEEHPLFRRCSPKAKVLLLMCALTADQAATSPDRLVAVGGGAAGAVFTATAGFLAIGGIGMFLAPSLIPAPAVVTGLTLITGICGMSSCKGRANGLSVGESRRNRLVAAKIKLDMDYKNNGTRKSGRDADGSHDFLLAFMEESMQQNLAELETMHKKNAALVLETLKTAVGIVAPIRAAEAAVTGATLRARLKGIAVVATAFVSPGAALAAIPGAVLGAVSEHANAQHGVQTAQAAAFQAAARHVLGQGAEGAFEPLEKIPTEQRQRALMARQALGRLDRVEAAAEAARRRAAAAPAAAQQQQQQQPAAAAAAAQQQQQQQQPAAAAEQPAAAAAAEQPAAPVPPAEAPLTLRQRAAAVMKTVGQGAAAVGQTFAHAAEGALELPPPPAAAAAAAAAPPAPASPRGGASPSMAMAPFINNRIVSTFDNMKIPANICSFLLMLNAADVHPEILMRIAIILAGPVGADSKGGSHKRKRTSLHRRRVKNNTRRRVAKK